MSQKLHFDAINVASPCSKNWNEMIGNDEVRFCSHCAKNVHNLSAMTRKQAKKLVAQSKGNLCIQYVRRPDGRIQTIDQKLYQIAGRASHLATSVFGAALALTNVAVAQTVAPSSEINATEIVKTQYETFNVKKDGGAGTLSGTITDPNDAVIPGVTVTLINQRTNEQTKTTTNNEGVYQFVNVAFAEYRIRFEGTAGFEQQTIENIEVTSNEEVKTDVTMSTGEVGYGGAMIAISYENPLIQAAHQQDLESVKQLIQHGADVNASEKDGKITALHAAVETGNLEIVRQLLSAGAKPNALTESGRTPLMQIDEDASVELVQLLLNYGADVNSADEDGDSALMNAVTLENSEILKLLISYGAKVNEQNKEGQTALMKAAKSVNLKNVRVLLEGGANPNLHDKDGDSAWQYTESKEIEQILLSFGVVLDKQEMIEYQP